MRAAEQLIAQHGLAQVSSRKIAEVAGNTNHSAVAYHFGGRDELIQAIVERQISQLEPRRSALIDAVGADGTVLDYVRCIVLPMTDSLAELPQPSWRARFLRQVLADPAIGQLFRGDPLLGPSLRRVGALVSDRLDDVSAPVLEGRFKLLAHMITDACAGYEERNSEHPDRANWAFFGHFLTDATAGMLCAPDTTRAESE